MKGEFELIEDIRRRFPAPAGIAGIGDDCAVIPQENGRETLISTDMLMEGTHFLLDDIGSYRLGWKSAASNFSDIAAMGGTPLGAFLAVSLPENLPDGWTDEFFKGFSDISCQYGFPLLGGDTTASPDRLCICVTVLGWCPAGKSVRRSGAVPGDLVCVTGCLGDSSAGLSLILGGKPLSEDGMRLVSKHYLPRPRISEGMALAACSGVHSMLDISDGIASDLRHIADESGVGIRIFPEKIPVSEELRRCCRSDGSDIFAFALAGGEDYELAFTVDPVSEPSLSVPHTVIGEVIDGNGVEFAGTEKSYEGYSHFRREQQ